MSPRPVPLAAFLVLALTLAVGPPVARGFSGHDVLQGPWHHEDISRAAALAAGFSRPAADAVAWNADYVDSYLYSPMWWARVDQGGGFTRFRYSMATAPELVKVHFDDLFSADDVRHTWRRYLTGTFTGLLWAAERGDVAAAHNLIGVSLHAIEDFYSHSSWLDDPARRTQTWFDYEPASRDRFALWTGAYEHSEMGGVKHHGKLAPECSALSQPALREMLEAACNALSPASNSSLCEMFKACRSATSTSMQVQGVTMPQGMVYLNPPGIALDNSYVAEVGVRTRGLVGPDGRLIGATTTKSPGLEMFDIAVDRATRSATQWLERLGQAMVRANQGAFWERVRTQPAATAPPTLWSQYEQFNALPYQFLTAGPYPPEPSQRAAAGETYLRVRLRTGTENGSGTDADIVLSAEGREFVLDYAPRVGPALAVNDFEAGDDFVYTVGPFSQLPGSIRLTNRSAGAGDIVNQIGRQVADALDRAAQGARQGVLSLVSGHADPIATNRNTWRPEALRALPASGQSGSLSLNGASEGNYSVSYSIARLQSGPADGVHAQPWARYRVSLGTLRCHKESKWDRGSNSDEPFLLVVVAPMPRGGPGGTRLLSWRTEPFVDVDDGESRPVNKSFDVDVPEGFGMIGLSVMLMESDDESRADRDRCLEKFRSGIESAVRAPEESMTDVLGRAVAADWKLAAAEVYAFQRGEQMRTGLVASVRPETWIAGRGSYDIPLDASRFVTAPVSASFLEYRTDSPAVVNAGGTPPPVVAGGGAPNPPVVRPGGPPRPPSIGSNPFRPERSPARPARAAFHRLRNRWKPDHFVHVQGGAPEGGAAPAGWWSAMWVLEPADGGSVRIRNRWKPDQCLHIEHGRLECGPVEPGWWSAMWVLEPADGGTVRIRNRWKPDQVLNIEQGPLVAAPAQPGWWSAMWTLDPVSD